MLIPKTKKLRDKVHLRWLRALPCLKCVQEFDVVLLPIYDNDPAHMRIEGMAGKSQKPGDDCANPLCQDHHREQHNKGERTFWGADLPQAIKTSRALYAVTQQTGPAIKIIGQWWVA